MRGPCSSDPPSLSPILPAPTQYEEMREEYFESLKDRVFLPLPAARAKKLTIDFDAAPPVAPDMPGVHVVLEDITALVRCWGRGAGWVCVHGKCPRREGWGALVCGWHINASAHTLTLTPTHIHPSTRTSRIRAALRLARGVL